MKEPSIIFSGGMVRAILKNTKFQTRRVIKPQPVSDGKAWACYWNNADTNGQFGPSAWGVDDKPDASMLLHCPYRTGGKLWVRETWKRHPELFIDCPGGCLFAADPGHAYDGPWKPSIFMPRWASRLTLEVTGIRVERLQEISEPDAIAEGCKPHIESKWWQGYHMDDPLLHQVAQADSNGMPPDWLVEAKPYRDLAHLNRSAKQEFEILWDSINGKRKGCAWNDNPWVWVIEFKKL